MLKDDYSVVDNGGYGIRTMLVESTQHDDNVFTASVLYAIQHSHGKLSSKMSRSRILSPFLLSNANLSGLS